MDSSKETLLHIRKVANRLMDAAKECLNRAKKHDDSKLESPEKDYFDNACDLSTLTYGSEEYNKSLSALKPALDHHYANNSHHPAHYSNGINGFDLFDLLEWLIDCKCSGERQLDGNILVSLEKNKERFNIDAQLYNILKNTAERYYR